MVKRGRYRGLSWDKKHQGWRVRIYFSGKQRHIGRFDSDVLAAKAYDKAAVYLYGSAAITNFGLEACRVDPTEVSTFIVLAKEQAQQEQLARSLHRQHYPRQNTGSPAGLTHQHAAGQQTYLVQHQHQQHQHQQQHSSMGISLVPSFSSSVNMVAGAGWLNAPAAGAAQGAACYPLQQHAGSMPGTPVAPGLVQQQLQPGVLQQVWVPAASSLPLMQLQPVAAGMQAVAVGPMAGAYLQVNCSAAAGVEQFPTNGYLLSSLPAAGALGTPAASTAMLLRAQQQPQQPQLLQGVQHSHLLQGYPGGTLSPQVAVSLSAVSDAPAALFFGGMVGQPELLLQHGGQAQLACVEASHSTDACGIGGSSFVGDMLHGLQSYAVARQVTAPALLQHHQQQLQLPQQGGLLAAAGASWMIEQAGASSSSAGGQPSWGLAQGMPVAAVLAEQSPSYGVAASSGGGVVLGPMTGASSACA